MVNSRSERPTLVIVDSLENPCCPPQLEPAEVELTLVGDGWRESYDATLDADTEGDTFVLLQDALSDVISELELPPFEISTFELEGQLADVAVCTPEGQRFPWDEAMGRLREHVTPPPLTAADIRDYEQGQSAWELISGFAGRTSSSEPGEEVQIATVTLLVDERGAVVRQTLHPHQGVNAAPPTSADLEQFILQGVVYPMNRTPEQGTAARIPAEIVTANGALHARLQEVVAALKPAIRAEHAPTPRADDALRALHDALKVPEACLLEVAPDTLSAFLAAAKTFYERAHWRRVAGNKYLAFRLDEEPWRYLNLMGQLGEEPGLAYFSEWLEVCELVYNQPSPFDLMLADEDDIFAYLGNREALTLVPLTSLHPDDEAAITALKNHRRYRVDGEYPLPLRIGSAGVRAPKLGLEVYTLLLTGIDQVLSKRRAEVISSVKTTLELDGHRLELRYPAKGDEAFVQSKNVQSKNVQGKKASRADAKDSAGTYKLTITDLTDDPVIVEVSGDADAKQVIAALDKAFAPSFEGFIVGLASEEVPDEEEGEAGGVDENIMRLLTRRNEGTRLWSRRETYGPKPFVNQLAARAQREPMWLSKWLDYFPVTFERVSDEPRPKDDAVRVLR